MDDFLEFRSSIQKFVRAFNVGVSKTPCGNSISPPAAHIIMLIAREKELPQSRLINELTLDKSNVARLCINLEKSGFLKRIRNVEDRRIYNITLTNKGLRLATKLEKDSKQFLTTIFKSVPQKNYKDINKTLELLTEACFSARGNK